MTKNTNNLLVKPISPKRALPIIMTKHYALCSPSISYSFGLFSGKELIGVCTFGSSARGIMKVSPWKILELNRLCLIKNIRNAASFLISRSIKLLPKEILLISYADINMDHHGYIYQASNWLYTGIGSTGESSYFLKNKHIHMRTINAKYGSSSSNTIKKLQDQGVNIKKVKIEGKYRYFYPVAKSKKQRKQMITWVTGHFGILAYPKGVNKNYDIEQIKNNQPKRKGFL